MVAPGWVLYRGSQRLQRKILFVRRPTALSVANEPKIVQSWVGEIHHIEVDDMIHATMRDLTDPSMPDEMWMFSSTNILDSQKHLVMPGRTFTFDVLSNSTWDIKLIDNGKWTKEEINQIDIEAKTLFEQLNPPPLTP